MKQVTEFIGWYAFLAAVLASATYASKSFLRFVLDKGAEGEQVYFAETLIALGIALFKIVSGKKLATACAFSVFLLILLLTDSSFYAALGYASISYAVGGIATPLFMREVQPLASPLVAPATKEVIDS